MGLDLSRFQLLKSANEKKREIVGKVNELSKPKADASCVGILYDAFCEFKGRTPTKFDKQRFVAVVVALCSPASLVGVKMAGGLRMTISRVAGMSPGSISSCVRNALWLYGHNVRFRSDVDLFMDTAERIISEKSARK